MVSAVRFQIYLFSTVVVLLQIFTSTESFNCDDKNAVYCLVKYLRANGKGDAGRLKTENGWQWVIKKDPSNENDVNVQWKNWTTVDNTTGDNHSGGGPCISLCLTKNNGSNNSLEAGQDGEPPCSKLLCSLLSLNNCTNVTSSNDNGVELPSRNNGPISEYGSPLYHKTHTLPASATYSSDSESFNTISHQYAITSGMKPTTPSIPETVNRSIQLFGPSHEYSKGDFEMIPAEVSQELTSTPSDIIPTITEEYDRDAQFYSAKSGNTKQPVFEIREPTSTTEFSIMISTQSPIPKLYSAKKHMNTISTITDTESPKPAGQFVDSSTETIFEPKANYNKGSFDYSTIAEAKSTTTPFELLINKYTYSGPKSYTKQETVGGQVYYNGEPLYSANGKIEGTPRTTTEFQVYEGKTGPVPVKYSHDIISENQERPWTTTENESYLGETSAIPQKLFYESNRATKERPEVTTEFEIIESSRKSKNPGQQTEENKEDTLTCIPRYHVLTLLDDYELDIKRKNSGLSDVCNCCSQMDRKKYILEFMNWYKEITKPNVIEEEPTEDNEMMYSTRLRPIKHNRDQDSDIPEIDDKYVVKNTYNTKPRNNDRYSIPIEETEARDHSVEQMHYYLPIDDQKLQKNEFYLQKKKDFENPPFVKERFENNGMHGEIPMYSFNGQPLMYENIEPLEEQKIQKTGFYLQKNNDIESPPFVKERFENNDKHGKIAMYSSIGKPLMYENVEPSEDQKNRFYLQKKKDFETPPFVKERFENNGMHGEIPMYSFNGQPLMYENIEPLDDQKLQKNSFYLQKKKDFESPPFVKERNENNGMHGKIAMYSSNAQPLMYEDIENSSAFEDLGKAPMYKAGDNDRLNYGGGGKFVSIYDNLENQERIFNPYGQHDHRFIIIKDNEDTRRYYENMLKAMNGRYKVQYVILDKNNHTRNIDLHKIFEEESEKAEDSENRNETLHSSMYKAGDNAIKDWYDKKYSSDQSAMEQNTNKKLGEMKVQMDSNLNQKIESPQQSDGSENLGENMAKISLLSPQYQTQLRRRISQQPIEVVGNELHQSQDGSYHHHYVSERPNHISEDLYRSIVEPDLKRVFVPDNRLSSLDFDKISKYVAKKLIKRNVHESLDYSHYKPHYRIPPTRKQQNVRKNLNSFEEAYLRDSFTPSQKFGDYRKSEADVIAELQHSGGIRKSKGWHIVHPDKIGLQIVSDLQKIRKNEMLRRSGKPLKIPNPKNELYQTTPKTIMSHQIRKQTVPNHGDVRKVQGHPKRQQKLINRNNNFNFHEVYPHSN